jgi:hypothetical protein
MVFSWLSPFILISGFILCEPVRLCLANCFFLCAPFVKMLALPNDLTKLRFQGCLLATEVDNYGVVVLLALPMLDMAAAESR